MTIIEKNKKEPQEAPEALLLCCILISGSLETLARSLVGDIGFEPMTR